MGRFKIDFNRDGCSSWPVALYFRRPCWHGRLTGLMRWEKVNTYKDIPDAKVFYNKIKDLPEYLA